MSKTIIPEMPAEMTWTSDQWKAIWASDQDILVAAAAGSGKTAVLVNRIIFKLLSEQVNVDELLVVTFTNASAAEMRHRIAEALEGAIKKNPDSQHLRKQLSLINRASISTLHSFCLEVIRKYYYEIEIDPGFRIADTTEAEILKDEMLDELLEEQYGIENNESFFQLVDAFSSDRNDLELQNIVRTLHEFSSSHPYPEEWLDEMVTMYDIHDDTAIDDLPFASALKYYVKLQLSAARDSIEEALRITKMPGGPASRAETLDKDLQLLEKLEAVSEQSWQAMFEAMSGVKFSTLKKATGDVDEELDKQCKKLRDQTKKLIQDLQKELFTRRPESYLKDMKQLKGNIAMLAELVKQFKQKYNQEKRERGIVDFSDLEHYCLAIFAEKTEDGQVKPSRIALKYRKHFKEVLVDEYQDTNLVQETILKLVSKDSEYEGNMFMVGDVKQSIYRFRLAEPNLFLGKYNRYRHDGVDGGLRIDLNKNFRSRKEVLDGTNFLFKQLMGVTVGEIEYDEDAELKKGAKYPENESFPIEVQFINQNSQESDVEYEDTDFEAEELENVQLEARLLAKSIKEMINEKRQITDLKTGMKRAVTYRDIVILMRSMTWTPGIMEEFKKQGIPIYGNLSSGYFEATEVAIMMSLLKVIDNPLQDIPLASVLRSAIVGLNEEQLAQIKMTERSGAFYDALIRFTKLGENETNKDYYKKVCSFVNQLQEWRELARQQSLADLIWQLYRDTKFYSYVGGMPGGKQRQANLRALFDRARQYEESSFRGLFRFLRFIERMQQRGDDLGAARALSEQEDVVRIMTIHSSKGLEFPVVFVAGLARQFNMMDLRKSYLLDKEFGFACSYTNPNLRITYPSLPQIAFKKKKQLEMIAEEMRVLYVALTRAKEKLVLIGTLKDSEKSLEKWRKAATHNDWLLKDYIRATAKSYSDWIGPALARHNQNENIYNVSLSPTLSDIAKHPSDWKLEIIEASALQTDQNLGEETDAVIWEAIKVNKPVDITSPFDEKIKQQLNWKYENEAAASHLSKQTVTEIKRQFESVDRESGSQLIRPQKSLYDRPAFMQEKSLSSAEKGTIMHMVMQQINLREPQSEASLEVLKLHLLQNEYLRAEQLEAVNNAEILHFFESDLAKRMQNAHSLQRELPFSMVIPASEAYSDWQGEDEPVLIQGVIDCLFEDEQGLVLVDYKTDRITGRFPSYGEAEPVLAKRYKVQIDLYSRAIESIMKTKLKEKYLYFFDDGGHLLKM
ncbi:helicase-exonuclease AddAB subunit AddA [Bacillus sp. AGMB 02131]|uniref:ATP-dependent helicase/nuclease subunit A n=1 Tax=Peribacillus faecalis TaxID=2772559 RepID=A0A927D057_9BACI|nr:helicase-exonuclease AddAB subunit AddA [Peribacillus faecalis]MBD3110284.1 helicase-exonuclease AddAB subunit AddA [Peribacillus faecalis]